MEEQSAQAPLGTALFSQAVPSALCCVALCCVVFFFLFVVPPAGRACPPLALTLSLGGGGLPVLVELGRSGIRRVVHRSGRLEVLGTEGPWDVSTGWWDAPVRRRYFQVTGPREVAWLFVEPETRDWFLAGWLD